MKLQKINSCFDCDKLDCNFFCSVLKRKVISKEQLADRRIRQHIWATGRDENNTIYGLKDFVFPEDCPLPDSDILDQFIKKTRC